MRPRWFDGIARKEVVALYLERKAASRQPGPSWFLILFAILLVVSACSRSDSEAIAPQTAESLRAASPPPDSTVDVKRAACENGVMLISDLPRIDEAWPPAVNVPFERAAAWHDDAQLVFMRVSCGLFEPGFRLQATFYSAQAQALFAADTGESVPVNLDPEEVRTLDMRAISYSLIRDALLEADFSDDLRLDPSTGVDIRINTEEAPFGPPETPQDTAIAHVSLEYAGQTVDLFIDASTGEIYRFATPA